MRRYSGNIENRSVMLANRRLESLSSTVNALFQKATRNEQIFRRYQQFEFKLLDLEGFEPLLDMLLRNSLEYFNLDCVELWLYDPQGTLEEILSEEYLSIPGFSLLNRMDQLQQLYGSQPEVRLLSTRDGQQLPVFTHQQPQSAALLPLVRQGVLVGSMHFGAKGHDRFTIDKSTDFIAHLSSIVAVCLENAVSQERLHRLSLYDMLTQVKNRRAFHQSLDREISRATRNGDPLSLLFVDLDYFKRINDTYGHPMGDKVLRVVAQTMSDMLRKTDHVCRYGGEEFSLILPNCSQQRAMEIAERIRQQVSELVIVDDSGICDDGVGQGAVEVRVTLSIGVCCWLPPEDLADGSDKHVARELIASSDRGVYQSKAAGRNAVHYVELCKAV